MAKKPTYKEYEGLTDILMKKDDILLQALEVTNVTVYYWDIKTCEISVDPNFVNILGYKQNSFSINLQNLKSLHRPDEWNDMFSTLMAHVRGEIPIYTHEHRLLTKTGEWKWIHTRGKVFSWDEDGSPSKVIGIAFDITERKNAENSLRKSEEKFRNLVEATNDWVWETDSSGKFTYSSPKIFDYLGYHPQHVLGKKPFEFMPAKEAAQLSNIFIELSKNPKPFEMLEHTIFHKDGRYLNVETNGVPIFDAKDNLVGWRGIEHNITKRKKAEEALRENRAMYRDLVETVNDIIWEIDTNGRFTYVSPRVYDILGYRPEEIIGIQFSDIIDSDMDPQGIETSWDIFNSEKPFVSLENKFAHKDNYTIIIESSGKPFFDPKGNLLGYRIINRDITERNQTKKALKESEERFRTFMETASDFMLIVDKDGNLTYVNESMARTLGYSKKELMGMYIGEILSKKILDETYMPNAEILVSKGEISPENIFLTKDNKEIYGEIKLTAFYDSAGNFAGSRGVFRDLSEHKQAEEEKEKLRIQLQQAKKMEAIGTLAGGVAHDLNNILSGIVSYPDLLLMQLPENSPFRAPILTMQETGQKAAAIVQDLLTLARRGVAVTEATNLNKVILSYLQSPEYNKMKSYHPGVETETDLDADIMNILGSPVHLSKTIMNLLSNAAEAMPNGGKIRITTENRYVSKVISGYNDVKEGDYVVLTVSDTGEGIPQEDMERIFEPFYTKKKMGKSGTGLGMAVVWGTILDHKGHIDLQSIPEKGTTFTLFFPITREELAEKQSSLPIEEYMGNGESILIVDDVKEQRQIASAILSELKYAVTTVSSGEEAVEYMQQHSTDLLVLDMIMAPGIDGLETYKKILQAHPQQKAIIASGFSETDNVKEAEKLGVGHYIKKPYTLEKIGTAVKAELEEE